jgi:hypothetical protein
VGVLSASAIVGACRPVHGRRGLEAHRHERSRQGLWRVPPRHTGTGAAAGGAAWAAKGAQRMLPRAHRRGRRPPSSMALGARAGHRGVEVCVEGEARRRKKKIGEAKN